MVNLDLLFQGHKCQLKILTSLAAGALGPFGLFFQSLMVKGIPSVLNAILQKPVPVEINHTSQ